jgi:hypothetical protein
MLILLTIHLALLGAISWLTNRGTVAERSVATLYIFYGIAPAFSFQLQYFDLAINHSPNAGQIAVMIFADIVVIAGLIAIQWLVVQAPMPRVDDRAFSQGLAIAAITALAIDVVGNNDVLFEYKGASNAFERLPNLILLELPYAFILIGALWAWPFESRTLRLALTACALSSIAITIVQGYRLPTLLLMMMWTFRYQRAIGPAALAGFLSVVGEVSSGLKVLTRQTLFGGGGDWAGYFGFVLENARASTWLTSEQMAIAANWDIFVAYEPSIDLMRESIVLLPGFRSASGIDLSGTATESIASLAGATAGEGTAFSMWIFLSLHPVAASLLLASMLPMARAFNRSILLPLAIAAAFGFFRDTPAQWLGQMKLLIALTFVQFLVKARRRARRPVRCIPASVP